jgi:acetyl-CoA C-acetyltransferase
MTPPSPTLTDADVVVAGLGMTPVGEHWDLSLRELALQAITAALQDAAGLPPQAVYVANMLSPILSHQSQLGALLADFAGFRGIEAVTVEAAGASGGAAVRQAQLAIASGAVDQALVIGVEKTTDRVTSEVESALSTASDVDYEAVQGSTRTAQAALLMRRYLHEHGAPPDALAGFGITAHANAVANPLAMYRRAISPEAYARAPMLSEPVTVYDAAPNADGAAAMLLARRGTFPENPDRPTVGILGSAVATAPPALHDQEDPLVLTAAARAATTARKRARIDVGDVDFFELHDFFSVYAALALEASGFAERGKGWKLAQDGHGNREGDLPILTFGGSKARGDTGGATGVYQAAEAVLQLQGRAGEAQVAGARIGMTQCVGGSGGTCATLVLGLVDGAKAS